MKNKILKQLLVRNTASVKKAMKVIDHGRLGTAFVVDEKNKFFGLVTDGDIRRAILNGISVEAPIGNITNKEPLVARGKVDNEEILNLISNGKIKRVMPLKGSLKIPVVDEKGKLNNVVFIYDDGGKIVLLSENKSEINKESIKKVLIIGGAGYLGSILSRKLLNSGYKVKVLDNLTYGDEGLRELYQNSDFEFIKGDIREISKIIESIKGTDAVVHLAAIVGDPASYLNPELTIETNYLATKSIAEACKFNQINKFLFASTCSVYGTNNDSDERLDENSSLNPASLYAETKLKSEEGILSLADGNFSPTIFRFATLYGVSPRMRFDLVVNLLTAKAVNEKKITIFGGKQWRPNLEASDAAEACIKWLESPIKKTGCEIFNVGSNELNFQIQQIGRIVKKIIPGTKIEIAKNNKDLRDYNVSFDKISKILNFKVRKTIEIGVSEIKKLIVEQKIKDFNQPQYSNYRFLSENRN